MEFRVLGPLEVVEGDAPLHLGAEKPRALLALLLLNANRVVSRERLIDSLWGDDPPETAVTSVQVYVSRLRKLLPDGMLVTKSPGYMLATDSEAIDIHRFEHLFAEGRTALAAGDPGRAARLLREALALWRGSPLAEFATEPFAEVESARLVDLQTAAIDARVEADLQLGRHAELVGELEQLISEHPHREALRAQLMLALYRSGRQADALEAFRQARAALDELGLEPSERLRSLEHAMLIQDPALLPAPSLFGDEVELPGPLRAASPFPFVGRTREIGLLREALARAENGEGGQVVLIGAEAGGGKTRLVRELAHAAAGRGTVVLYGASSADVNMPYGPFVEALEFLVRVSDPAALDECIGDRRGELARLLPGLGEAPRLPAEDVQTARHRLHNAVAELFARVAAERSLFLVVDDIHWADSASVELLAHLARAAPEARICLVAAYRGRSEDVRPELAGALAGLARVEGVTRIALGALTRDDIGEFIAKSAGAHATGELTEAIDTLTDGTPFLLCELWRALTDADGVEVFGSEVRLNRPVAELSSPESVRDVVRYRVSRLSRETIAMLELAAVAGTEFELGVLGGDATTSTADEAVESGMIEPLSEHGASLRFTHELVRRAVYDGLPSVRRAELHLSVGESLEREHAGNDRFVAELAHHFTAAAPVAGIERAVLYNVRAAETAAAALAFDAAANDLATALELGIADPSKRAALGFELGAALLQSGRLADSDAALTRSIDDASSVDNARLRAHASVLRNHVRLRTDAPAARAETRAVAQDAVDTFMRLGDSGGLAQAWRLLSHVHIRDCHWAQATLALETALAHARASGDKRELARVVSWLVTPLYYGPMPADDVIRRYEELREEYGGDPYVDAMVSCHLAGALAMATRFDDARAEGERALAMLDDYGLRIAAAQARAYVSDALLLAGDLDAAERELRTAYDITADAGDSSGVGFAFELAAVLCAEERYADAEAWAAKGRANLGESDVMTRVAGLTVEAELASQRGAGDDAVRAARAAVELAAQTDALNIRAHALSSQSAVLRAAGAGQVAAAAHDEAVRLFRAKGNAAALAQAVARFESTTVRSGRRVTAGET